MENPLPNEYDWLRSLLATSRVKWAVGEPGADGRRLFLTPPTSIDPSLTVRTPGYDLNADPDRMAKVRTWIAEVTSAGRAAAGS